MSTILNSLAFSKPVIHIYSRYAGIGYHVKSRKSELPSKAIIYFIRQTKFLTGCEPMDGKSTDIGCIRSSLDCTPAFSKPF